MTQAARVTAQAKINLLLRVLGRDVGGYHGVETILLRVDLCDDVRVRVTTGRSLDCTGSAMPAAGLGPIERNLAYRAAAAYTNATGWPQGFAIEIDKRIPVGGGLGGGSADAGAVLRALDALSPNPLGDRLIEIATPLGADVPFMTIENPMALAWSRGERLLALRAPAARPVLLAVPDFGVSAGDAYSWLSADRGDYAPAAELFDAESLATWESLALVAENDLEPVVVRRHAVIGELVDELRAAAPVVAMMSGSGSAVFGIFEGPPDAAFVDRPGVITMVTATSERVAPVLVES